LGIPLSILDKDEFILMVNIITLKKKSAESLKTGEVFGEKEVAQEYQWLRGGVGKLSLELIGELLNPLLKANCLHLFVQLLIAKLSQLMQNGSEIRQSIAQTNVQNKTSNKPVEVEQFNSELDGIEQEKKDIVFMIFTILSEVSTSEKNELQKMNTSGLQKKLLWITAVFKEIFSIPQIQKEVQKKLKIVKPVQTNQCSEIQAHIKTKSIDEIRAILVEILKGVFESENSELRSMGIIWLLQEGKIRLIDNVDSNSQNPRLTKNLIELIQKEDLFGKVYNLSTYKYLIDNLIKRKEVDAALEMILRMINGEIAEKKDEGEGRGSEFKKDLSRLSGEEVSSLLGSLSSDQAMSNGERRDWALKGLKLVSENAPGNKQWSRALDGVLKAILFQQEIIQAVEFQIHQQEAITSVVSYLKDPKEGGAIRDLLFEQTDRLPANWLDGISAENDLVKSRLNACISFVNARIWDLGTLQETILVPFKIYKLLLKIIVEEPCEAQDQNLQRVWACVSHMIAEADNQHTTVDLILQLHDQSLFPLVPKLSLFQQLQNPRLRELLKECYFNEIIWPANISGNLVSVSRNMRGVLPEPYYKQLVLKIVREVELVNLRSPYFVFLINNMEAYLDFTANGEIRLLDDDQGSKYFKLLLDDIDLFWPADLLFENAKALNCFELVFEICISLRKEYLKQGQNSNFIIFR
jgi:hypothetical protein